MSHIDLLIIGGGINGTGIAADAVGRGLSVHLCEQNDLASGTSSMSYGLRTKKKKAHQAREMCLPPL